MFAGVAEGGEELQLGNHVVRDGPARIGLETKNLVEIRVFYGNLLRRMSLVVRGLEKGHWRLRYADIKERDISRLVLLVRGEPFESRKFAVTPQKYPQIS
jgi:hypothetical protein